MKKYIQKGYLNGIIAAVSYGTNPLFALPLLTKGFDVNSILFYRYFFAVLIYGSILIFIKKLSLKISFTELLILFSLAIVFSLSSLFLFDAFNYIEAGLACTILFAYPIMVAIISKIFFGEKMPPVIWLALFLVTIGISLLYNGKPNETLNIKGVILVLLSSLSYAIYMVGIKHIKSVKHMKPDKLTFYVMLFGLSVYVWNLDFCRHLQPITNIFTFGCAIMLSIFPTIVSLESITVAIKFIGATKTAILGALEPITAIAFGILLFGETLTLKIFCGIVFILTSVSFVILNKSK